MTGIGGAAVQRDVRIGLVDLDRAEVRSRSGVAGVVGAGAARGCLHPARIRLCGEVLHVVPGGAGEAAAAGVSARERYTDRLVRPVAGRVGSSEIRALDGGACHSRGGAVDSVDIAGEVPVTGTRPAEEVVRRDFDRVVVGQVQPESAAAATSARGDGLLRARAADVGDRWRTTEAVVYEVEVRSVNAGDALAEGHVPV